MEENKKAHEGAQEKVDNINDIFEKLQILSEPLTRFLEENYNPHCYIVINMDGTKILEDKISIPNIINSTMQFINS